ncbi:hypothetical protein DFJ74DRAFT_515367 [Hyaloraphidium curvatum]|nr:hypothetical protein DFJ74DRAFT_515367 [Hyaloraphidium curvatum]
MARHVGCSLRPSVDLPTRRPDVFRPQLVTFPTTGPYAFTIRAWGMPAAGVWPVMQLQIDGRVVASFSVRNGQPGRNFAATVRVAAGRRRIGVAYVNDFRNARQDRNLVVVSLTVVNNAASNPRRLFPYQSVAIVPFWGFDFFGTRDACTGPGCRAIDVVAGIGATDLTVVTWTEIPQGGSAFPAALADTVLDASVRMAIRYARSKGLSVTLKPSVGAFNPDAGWALTPQTSSYFPSDPAAFFDSLEANILQHAVLAREMGASIMAIGTELGGKLSGAYPEGGFDNCARWRTLIANVRAANPALKLTYAATLAPFWDYMAPNEATRVCFWDQMDYIGLNAYPNMNYLPAGSKADAFYRRVLDNGIPIDVDANDGTGDPAFSLANYKAAYGLTNHSQKAYFDFVVDTINAQRRAKGLPAIQAIMTESGTTSTSAALDYWGVGAATVDNDAQAEGWDGFLRAFQGDPRIFGINVWNVLPMYSRAGPNEQWIEDIWKTDYDFTGKPAERVLCRWFSGGTAPLCR